MSDQSENQKQNIAPPPDLRKWRIELPNMIDDSDLSPYAVRLLLHYYRVGGCWESVRSTAQKCKMSVGMVVKAREELNGVWITVSEEQNQYGTLDIAPIDRWAENFEIYSSYCSCGEQGCSCGERRCSPGEPKKEPIKKDDVKRADVKKRTSTLTKLYESNIGPITPLMADILRNAAIDYPNENWYKPAFEIAVKNQARSWSYVDKILAGWKQHGFGWKPRSTQSGKNGSKPAKNPPIVRAPKKQTPVIDPEKLQSAPSK